MQQTKSYWRVLGAAGVLGAFVASACVVTSSSDNNTAGSSNSSGAGGSTTAGGGTTSGAGATTAGASNGGSGGISTSVPFECDPPPGGAGPLGTPNTCPGTGNVCSACIQNNCCTEYAECYATDPGNQCGWGGPQDAGEFPCMKDCLEANVQKGGVSDDEAVGTCASSCATTKANLASQECMLIGDQTSDLIACVNGKCQTECFGG
jgi:hypothetical protein